MKDQLQTIREALTLGWHQAIGPSSDLFTQALKALEAIEADHFTAADMADAQAKSFRDGVASVTAGQEPVGYLHPQARQRLENGETVAFRKTPYAGEPTLAVYVGVAPVAQQPQAEAVPVVTPAMVDAYLKANTAYWQQADELPKSPTKWINGTVQEATRVSLTAALAAAPQQAEAVPPGYVPVPVEPTDEMVDAACEAVKDLYRVDFVRAYEAAIAQQKGQS